LADDAIQFDKLNSPCRHIHDNSILSAYFIVCRFFLPLIRIINYAVAFLKVTPFLHITQWLCGIKKAINLPLLIS